MTTYKFEVAEHEDFGTKGFRPTWYPQGDPLGGMGVAHDILEHFPKDDGGAEGEFMALGASLFIRGESGYFQRNGRVHSAEENLASDFPEIWNHMVYEDRRTHVKPCGSVRDEDLMERCREIVRLGVRELREREHDQIPDREARERMARWFAKGYKKAERRYRQHGAYAMAYQLFSPIEEQAERCLKYADEGMVLTVCVNVKRLNVSVSCEYPQEEDY